MNAILLTSELVAVNWTALSLSFALVAELIVFAFVFGRLSNTVARLSEDVHELRDAQTQAQGELQKLREDFAYWNGRRRK